MHWIDLLANLGLTVESVQGFWPGNQRGDERSMAVVAQYEEGGVGVLLHSWETPSLLRGLRLSKVTGVRGSITFESNGAFALIRSRHSRLVVPRCAMRAATARCCATFCGCSPRAASRS